MFIASLALIQSHSKFNRLLLRNFLTCYSCLYNSSMVSTKCLHQEIRRNKKFEILWVKLRYFMLCILQRNFVVCIIKILINSIIFEKGAQQCQSRRIIQVLHISPKQYLLGKSHLKDELKKLEKSFNDYVTVMEHAEKIAYFLYTELLYHHRVF